MIGRSYFKKSTKFTPPSDIASRRWNFTWDSEAWGQDGPVQCSIPPFEWPTFPAFRTAFKEVETATGATPIPFPREGHNGLGVGVLWVPNSQDPETQSRSSALTAYFNPIRGRKNFQLLTKTKATRILFEGRRAVGIEVVDRQTGGTLHIRAEKEVILAAGPIFSPNILHKSGVGPKEMLERSNVSRYIGTMSCYAIY
jgi:choline dehydrogenase-like flavoprotein